MQLGSCSMMSVVQGLRELRARARVDRRLQRLRLVGADHHGLLAAPPRGGRHPDRRHCKAIPTGSSGCRSPTIPGSGSHRTRRTSSSATVLRIDPDAEDRPDLPLIHFDQQAPEEREAAEQDREQRGDQPRARPAASPATARTQAGDRHARGRARVATAIGVPNWRVGSAPTRLVRSRGRPSRRWPDVPSPAREFRQHVGRRQPVPRQQRPGSGTTGPPPPP